MLEIRNLTKIYRSKTGEEVRALNDVSISFPESGMIFILGKSGSGKSTLLNIMGGLDSYDSGEFIIKGKSSKDFAGSDFDAYRNTFIGFIFQEYNVLDDFTVGANIGLALELQGKKATDEKINDILSQVDLLSFAKRKPNELSGGQKQRVAIARALVKEPQIIMADEPTGALDSNTGKQIFDTLKELSRQKLVLIVSHDRDFAERYADRIVELADGQIISDVTKHSVQSKALSDGIQQITGNILRIKGGYRLTEQDLQMINDYLSANEGDVMLSSDSRVNEELRSAAGIGTDGSTSVFEGTSTADYELKQYDKANTKFIHSRLPIKNAVKIGSSGLKHKKFRLVMTIFLSLIAFALFGFADSLGAYNKISAAVKSIQDSHVNTAALSLGVRREVYRDGELSYHHYEERLLNDNDITLLKEKTGIDFIPVYGGSDPWNTGFSLSNHFEGYEQNNVYNGRLTGMVSISPDTASQVGLTVTGRLPEAEGEIAITELTYRQFNEYGFRNTTVKEAVKAGELTMTEGDRNSILGKHITLQGRNMMQDMTYKIVGVVDTGFDYERYNVLLPNDEPTAEDDGLATMVLQTEVANELSYGFHMLGFLCETDLETFSNATFSQTISETMSGVMNKNISFVINTNLPEGEQSEAADEKRAIVVQKGDIIMEIAPGLTEQESGRSYTDVAGSEALSLVNVTWLDGTARTALGANELVVPKQLFDELMPSTITITVEDTALGAEVDRLFGQEGAWASTDPMMSYADRLSELARKHYIDEQLNDPELRKTISENLFYENPELFGSAETFDPSVHTLDKAILAEKWSEKWMHGEEYFWNISVSRYEVEEAAKQKLSDFLLPLIKLDQADKYFTENKDALHYGLTYFSISPAAKLSELYADHPDYTIEQYQFEEMFKRIYAYRCITENNYISDEAFIEAIIKSDENYADQWLQAERNSSDEDSKKQWLQDIAVNAYCNYLSNESGGSLVNSFGAYTGTQLRDIARTFALALSDTDLTKLTEALTFSLKEHDYESNSNRSVKDYDFKIVGYFTYDGGYNNFIISDTVLADYREWYDTEWQANDEYQEVVAEHEDGKWSFVLAPMPTDPSVIQTLVELGYDEESDLQFTLRNAVMNTLSNFNEFIEVGAMVFLYVGIGFAVFSALLLMNFISTSISYKKREIGVLRAVGARSSDVFKIFFSESLIIALINFVLAMGVTIAAVVFANGYMRSMGINVTLLTFGVRQIALMLLVSVLVALLASFLPVYSIAKRKPIDAIKDR